MDTFSIPMGVKYVGLVASPELKAKVAGEAAQLARFAAQLDYVTLSVGRWHLHQNQGHVYRVTLDISLGEGVHPLAIAEESAVDAAAPALEGLLGVAFGTAARQLGAVLARPA